MNLCSNFLRVVVVLIVLLFVYLVYLMYVFHSCIYVFKKILFNTIKIIVVIMPVSTKPKVLWALASDLFLTTRVLLVLCSSGFATADNHHSNSCS